MNRQDNLLKDDQVVVEDEPVDGRRHRTFERVLDGHERLIDVVAATAASTSSIDG